MNKPLILVTNDDGITAPGIKSLVSVARKFGEVVVVAPDSPQSGMGHAITLTKPLRLNPSDMFEGVTSFECSGTPADCVKIAVDKVLDRKPDLCISGINHGSNSSINVIYSGTMSAAVEGAMENIPSIGFSLADFHADADFRATQMVAKELIANALKGDYPEHVCGDVNVPKGTPEELKGIKVCKQAYGFWEDRFDKRLDQFGRPYFWLTGAFSEKSDDKGSDLYALTRGYISIVPTTFDLTNYTVLNQLNTWNI